MSDSKVVEELSKQVAILTRKVAQLSDEVMSIKKKLKIKSLEESAELWTVEDIATWLKLSVVSVKMRVITRDDFPRAVSGTVKAASNKRWPKLEVLEWGLTHGREREKTKKP